MGATWVYSISLDNTLMRAVLPKYRHRPLIETGLDHNHLRPAFEKKSMRDRERFPNLGGSTI